MKKWNKNMTLKALVLFTISLISITVSYAMNPIIWGQEVFHRLQSQPSEKLTDYLYVSKEQMKIAILDEMKARGVEGELVKRVEQESISAEVYN